MSATRARKGRLTVTPDTPVVAEAMSDAGRGYIEVTGPPFGASLHEPLTGTDRWIPADEGAGIPGSRRFSAWLLDLADEYEAAVVVLQPSAVRHAVEHSSLDALRAGLKPLTDTGLDVLVNTAAITQQSAPTSQPVLTRIGEKVGTHFAIGKVREVPSNSLHALRSELDTLGRAVTFLSYAGPDRLIAARHGSIQRLEHRLFGYRSGQSPAAWLRDVVLAHEPLLLIVEGEALARADLDLDGLAKTHRVAVGLLPAPTNPGHTTPQTIQEAR